MDADISIPSAADDLRRCFTFCISIHFTREKRDQRQYTGSTILRNENVSLMRRWSDYSGANVVSALRSGCWITRRKNTIKELKGRALTQRKATMTRDYLSNDYVTGIWWCISYRLRLSVSRRILTQVNKSTVTEQTQTQAKVPVTVYSSYLLCNSYTFVPHISPVKWKTSIFLQNYWCIVNTIVDSRKLRAWL